MTKFGSRTWTDAAAAWPALPLDAWRDTYATLHMWTQIVGKIRLRLSPPRNHWWHCTLYVTSRGLTMSPIPYESGIFEIQLDFLEHQLEVHVSGGTTRRIPLVPRSVADFYRELMATLRSLGIDVEISAKPDEVPDPIPFAEDTVHASYDAECATRFWRILVSADSVFKEFRSRFIGKASPFHFFWGSFDLAVTRFSGRPAPPRAGADAMTREAMSHEESSAGFWPGGGTVQGSAFYSYIAPAPPGLADSPIQPTAAFYHTQLGEFLLMYDDLRRAASPRASCSTSYRAPTRQGQISHGGTGPLSSDNRETRSRPVKRSVPVREEDVWPPHASISTRFARSLPAGQGARNAWS